MNTLYNKLRPGKGPVMSREEIMAQFSLLIGIWSVISSICCYTISGIPASYILGLIGITLALLSKQGGKFSTKGRIGFICSIVGIIVGLLMYFMLVFTLQSMKDPALRQQIMDMLRQQIQVLPADLQQAFTDMYGL